MARHALVIVLSIFGSCIEDGKAFLAGGGIGLLAGSSKDRANKVTAPRLVPGDAHCSQHGIGGILEDSHRNRPTMPSALGQKRPTSYSRLKDVFGEIELDQAASSATATPPTSATTASKSAGGRKLQDKSNKSKQCAGPPSQEKSPPASGLASEPCSAGVKEAEAADTVGKPSLECESEVFSASTADIATIIGTNTEQEKYYRAPTPDKPAHADYAGYMEVPTGTFGCGLHEHPQQYENIGRAALDPDLSPKEMYAVVEENVLEILARTKLLKQALSDHGSFANTEQATPVVPRTEFHGGFFNRHRSYKSPPNTQEQRERDVYAKSVLIEEGENEPGTGTAGTPVGVNNGCDMREGDDVGAQLLTLLAMSAQKMCSRQDIPSWTRHHFPGKEGG